MRFLLLFPLVALTVAVGCGFHVPGAAGAFSHPVSQPHLAPGPGHTGSPGTAPGYLDRPDGVDLVPPAALLSRIRASVRLQP